MDVGLREFCSARIDPAVRERSATRKGTKSASFTLTVL